MNQPLRILISHLTRMTYPRICIAGIEENTGIHVRPITGRKDTLEFSQVGSLFQLGRLIDVGWNLQRPNPPEVEDCYFKPSNVTRVTDLGQFDFWQSLEVVAESSLNAIFGDELHPSGRTLAIPNGRGIASLGELRAKNVRLVVEKWDGVAKLRMTFDDTQARSGLRVAVTDLRFFKPVDGQFVVQEDVVDFINQKLTSVQEVILSVGLSRAFAEKNNEHWLQVNGIHLESDPLWHV